MSMPSRAFSTHIGADQTAMRYGVAIGRDGLYEPGTYRIGRKQQMAALDADRVR